MQARRARRKIPASSNMTLPAANEPQDYRRRMWINIAALAFILVLTALGVWLATTISSLRQTQDCLMVGRRNCNTLPLSGSFSSPSGESI